MNIFVLDRQPHLAARYMCDNHVPKMLLESAQLLCNRFSSKMDVPYKNVHMRHPCTLWLFESSQNLRWFATYCLYLTSEYSFRFEKTHKSGNVIVDILERADISLDSLGLQNIKFVQAFGDASHLKSDDPVLSYREYYKYKNRLWKEKGRQMRWARGRKCPHWMEGE